MSDLAAASGRSTAGWTFAAVACAIAAVVLWFVAGIVDDGLYLFTCVLGVLGFALGMKARREASRAGTPRWPATTAMVVGGFLGGLVGVFAVAYTISELV